MANYYASARSNYFRVKDAEAFEAAMGNIPSIEVITREKDGEILYGILCNDADGGGWPSWIFNEETEDYDELDLFEEVCEHLADDEVAVFMEAGAEKLRYITGYAVAINNKGESKQIGLQAIYELAKELGNNITAAEY